MADHDTSDEVRTARGRKFLRLFLMVAGGLAAPCLALAVFFLTNTGGADPPVARSATVHNGQVTTTTRARPTATTATTATTTTTTAPPPGRPPRDPFVPLVTQAPAGTPAR